MLVAKKVLENDIDCWMCPAFNKKLTSGKLVNHAKAGFKCNKCQRHAHSESEAGQCCAVEHDLGGEG